MTAASPVFLTVPIGTVKESPHNPRKHYDQKAIDELAASIKEKGVITPLLVRPLNGTGAGTYEIIGGSRRIRAAKDAGLAQVPILVRMDLTESDALELMIIDNLQQQDVHPLDEALGYEYLIKQYADELRKNEPKAKLDMDATMKRIAEKIGKSTSYIYQRLKLNGLIEPVQKALFNNELTPGHAILIARLQPPDQKRALEVCTAITSAPQTKFGHRDEAEAEEDGMISVRALAAWIKEYVHVNVDSVAFDKTDAQLNPEAGPCTTCKKLVGNDPELHPEIKNKRTCTDHTCFRKKVNAHFLQTKKRYGNRLYPITATTGGTYIHQQHDNPLEPAEFTPRTFDQGLKGPGRWKEYKLKQGETEKTKRIKFGLFVEGDRKGECIPIALTETKVKHQSSSSSGPSQAQLAALQRNEDTRILEKKIKDTVARRVIDAIVDKVTTLPRLILETVPNRWNIDEGLKLVKTLRQDTSKLTDRELLQAIAAEQLCDSYSDYHSRFNNTGLQAIKHYKIDAKAIEKKVRKSLSRNLRRKLRRLPRPKSRTSGIAPKPDPKKKRSKRK